MTVSSASAPPASRARFVWHGIDAQPGIPPAWQTLVFVAGLLIVFSRLPGAWLHPQFFAEDGWVWYQQAYNLHWLKTLTIAQAGYLQTLPRLVAGVALWFPMLWAPLIMNMAGAAIQVLPVCALLSRRCSTWGPLPLRLVMAVSYLAIPNAPEVHIVLTNAMWHLAVLQALLAFSKPPFSWPGRACDVLLFGIGSVSGPFCILLLPCVAGYWLVRRYRWTLIVLSILSLGAALQVFTMMHAVRTPGTPLGMTWERLLRIVAGNIFVNSMVGGGGAYMAVPLLLLAATGGLLILIGGWYSGTAAFRLYMLFALFALAASLRDPLLLEKLRPRWEVLGHVSGIRYWFLPSLMFLWSAACCAWQGKTTLLRLSGRGVLLLSLFGIFYKWSLPEWPATQYREEIARFKTLKSGEHMLFQVHDPGGRPMELVKR